MPVNRIVAIVAGGVAMLIALIMSFRVLCEVDSGEIVVLQSVNGDMTVWTTPGWHWQGFGTLTRYSKSDHFWFKAPADRAPPKPGVEAPPEEPDESIPVRFHDQGGGKISGSLSFDLPTDEATMLKLHQRFRSMEAIKQRLVRPAVIRAVYNSGPLMSSKESAGQRRGDLIQYIQEQTTRGVYKTATRESEMEDLLAPPRKVVELVEVPVLDEKTGKPQLDDAGKPVTRKEPQQVEKPATKKIAVVEIVFDKGMPAIQEASSATELGIRMYNITIERILYEGKVQEQIDKQRDMEMAIQTKISEAKQAEQDSVTTEKKGQAEAAAAKWAQEVKKAQAITAAEQQNEVAKKDLESAKLERQAIVERAQGEAEAKKLTMQADGALKQKLDAYVEVNKAYAAELGKQRWVPDVQMGGSANGNAALNVMELLQVKTARDLALDVGVKR